MFSNLMDPPFSPIFPAGLRRGWPGWKKFCIFKKLDNNLGREKMTLNKYMSSQGDRDL